MALTGLFLISFLLVHLLGNFQLLHHDEGRAFNLYARFMTSNPIIKTMSYLLYSAIILHVVWAVLLTRQNRKARGSGVYAIKNKSADWSSRNMGFLGAIVFIFLVIHLKDFWYVMHNGPIETQMYDGSEVKDLYAVVVLAFSQAWYVILYVVSMAMLAFHLWHGFASAFQTLGLNHLKYNGLIQVIGRTVAIVIPLLFALIPVLMFLNV